MPPTATTTRGERVARRRSERGLSQEELARRCGCSVRTIQRIEDDGNRGMSQRLIEALHEHLAMPIGELVDARRASRKR